ncbi:non-hydrolyzing UDP-N-acetylglucosamine 2-epimerase [Ramlibacter agri]|nr:UDP-N-acetylglucosamine 2-epimerase (non-hydrolyzing) [Ramlibacter agri]
MSVVGARPQFVKAAVLSAAIQEHRPDIREVLVHTGQHYDDRMSEIFFRELGIEAPAHNLGVGGGSHGRATGQMLEGLERVMQREGPDGVLVYGDTNSTIAAALAAVKLHIPVAHVEAGLRSFNRTMPEEINRVVTDHISELLFAPTQTAESNLFAEGIERKKVHVVGDVMYDAAIYFAKRSARPSWFSDLGFDVGRYVLCTIHRAENTDSLHRLEAILRGLALSGSKVILPMHPRTAARIAAAQLEIPANVTIVEPVGYLEMCWLEANSTLIATDSGGVQKEAYFHKKFCVTLREETEWVELVDSGCNVLAGADSLAIANAISSPLTCDFSREFYGRGSSARAIAEKLWAHA